MAALDHSGIVGSVTWAGEAGTQACAACLARAFQALPSPAHVFIELRGPLGAGKTSFARHLLRALGVEGRIKSPSYAVLEAYEVPGAEGPVAVSHFDFYRFSDPDEWEEAGFREVFAAPGLKLVEWAEKAAGPLPPPDLVLDIHSPGQAPEDHRRVDIAAHGPTGLALARAAVEGQ